MAKIVTNGSPSGVHTKNGDVLTKAVLDMSEAMTFEKVENWVGMSDGQFQDKFEGKLGRCIDEVRVRRRKSEEARLFQVQMKAHRKPFHKSKEFIRLRDISYSCFYYI